MNLVSHMKTKKALGALLGLLGSLPAFPFLPLAGFSAPLLFTANLNEATRRTEREKVKSTSQRVEIELFRWPRNRSARRRSKKQGRGVVILTWHRPWRRPWIWPPSWRIPAETTEEAVRSVPIGRSGVESAANWERGGSAHLDGRRRGEGRASLALGGEREEETERGGRRGQGIRRRRAPGGISAIPPRLQGPQANS